MNQMRASLISEQIALQVFNTIKDLFTNGYKLIDDKEHKIAYTVVNDRQCIELRIGLTDRISIIVYNSFMSVYIERLISKSSYRHDLILFKRLLLPLDREDYLKLGNNEKIGLWSNSILEVLKEYKGI